MAEIGKELGTMSFDDIVEYTLQAIIQKNEARTQATATVELYVVDSAGAPHTSTITETFSL